MAAPQRGLGRGLGALIPTAQAPAPAEPDASALAEYAEIPVDEVAPNPRQPRTIFDEDAQAELVHSIQMVGLLQPVVVRRTVSGFELVAGERRLRAGRSAGLTHIPAIIRSTDDDDLLRDALLENLHRSNLNALEEAAAYAQLLADFGCSQEELASRIGRSRPQVSNTLRLLKLPPDVQRRVAAGVLSAGHARALLSLEDPAAMDRLAQRIVAEGLSVRAVEELILLGEADGKERTKTSRQRKKAQLDPALESIVSEVTETLQHTLDTRVHVEGVTSKNSRARIVIECADIEDVQRIAGVISG
jgi:ParB family transcriptional regulator, chromosome partitioning protein